MKIKALALLIIALIFFTGCTKNEYVDNVCPYSIMVQDKIYYQTHEVEVKDVKIIGQVTSVIPESKMPTENNQANIDIMGADYGEYQGGIVVLINEKWVFFKPLNIGEH